MALVARVLARSARLAPCRRPLATRHWTRALCYEPPATNREAEALIAALQEADKQAIRQSYLESVAAAADFVDSLRPAEPSRGNEPEADAAASLPSSVMNCDADTSIASSSALAAAVKGPPSDDSVQASQLEDYLVGWARTIAANPSLLAENWLRSLRRAVRRDLMDRADVGSASPSLMDADELLACLASLSARGILGASGGHLHVAIERKRSERALTPPGFASTVWRSTHGHEMKAWRAGAEGPRPVSRRRAGPTRGRAQGRARHVEVSGEESPMAETRAPEATRGGAAGRARGADIFGTPEYRGFVSSGARRRKRH